MNPFDPFRSIGSIISPFHYIFLKTKIFTYNAISYQVIDLISTKLNNIYFMQVCVGGWVGCRQVCVLTQKGVVPVAVCHGYPLLCNHRLVSATSSLRTLGRKVIIES